MHVALIIGGSIVGVGAVLYLHHCLTEKKQDRPGEAVADEAAAGEPAEECCGMHVTCERDSLSPVFGSDIVYFDDEELDVYAGRTSDGYDADEIDRFRDVLLTLRPDDIAPWARSIQQRGIVLPDAVRDELFMIVNEERQKRVTAF